MEFPLLWNVAWTSGHQIGSLCNPALAAFSASSSMWNWEDYWWNVWISNGLLFLVWQTLMYWRCHAETTIGGMVCWLPPRHWHSKRHSFPPLVHKLVKVCSTSVAAHVRRCAHTSGIWKKRTANNCKKNRKAIQKFIIIMKSMTPSQKYLYHSVGK